MNNDLKIFDNEEFGEIRTVTIEGEPWFVGNDCARALGYKNLYNGVIKNTDEEDRRLSPVGSTSGTQESIIINESGLYSLIFSSKLESARRFKHWVTSEVLPSIRKTGNYTIEEKAPEQIPIGEVASYTKVLDRIAVRQGQAPYKIAEAFFMVSEQFGIHLPADFVKIPEYEQLRLPVEIA